MEDHPFRYKQLYRKGPTMTERDARPATPDAVDRMVAATNAHDVDALVDCFALDYRLVAPAHPARGFSGREQVRRNWTEIFAAVPDVRCEVLSRVDSANTVWAEMLMSGRRRDGTLHEMAGVFIATVHGDLVESGRFYLELVDHSPLDADAAVRASVDGHRT